MTFLDRLVVGLLPFIPKPVVAQVSKRYIAGETLEEALAVACELNNRGFAATVDMLGEDATDIDHAREAAHDYRKILNAVGDHAIDGNISVKPTQFGLKVDYALCRELFRELIGAAAGMGYFVRVEMEDSSCTALTVKLYESLLKEFDNVGIVIQAYLHRSRADVERLLVFSPNVRVVKGVYAEPASIACQGKEEIRDRYVELSEKLFRAGCYVALATHDRVLIERISRLIETLGLRSSAYEFQMLLGVAEKARQRLLDSGQHVRVYVPFGEDWYPYSLRRLRENPRIAGYIVSQMLGRA